MKKAIKLYPLTFVALSILWMTSCSGVKNTAQGYQKKNVNDYYYIDKIRNNTYITFFYDNHHKRLHGSYVLEGKMDSMNFSTDSLTFKKGKLFGNRKEYVNDTLVRVTHYVNGLEEGVQKVYNSYSDSVISYYKNGIKQGIEKSYKNSNLIIETHWVNGIKQGKETYFNPTTQSYSFIDYTFIPDNKNYDQLVLLDKINDYLKLKSGDDIKGLYESIGHNYKMAESVSTFVFLDKYLGKINVVSSGDLSKYIDDEFYNMRPYFNFDDVISDSVWKTLADDKYYSYDGFFYIIEVKSPPYSTFWIAFACKYEDKFIYYVKVK